MERWRSYFGKSGADIWTVIQQAINIAALDYPMDFRERRGEIAETLFARNLLVIHARDFKDDPKLIISGEYEPRGDETCPRHMSKRLPLDADNDETCHRHISQRPPRDADDDAARTHSNAMCVDGDAAHAHLHGIRADDDDDTAHVHPHNYCNNAEALLEKDTLIIRELDGIKASIMDGDQPENIVLEGLQRLQCMQITVGALKATEIGKQVKCLKKHPSKRVRAIVKELVRHWKVLVDEWVSSGRDVAAAEATGTVGTEYGDCFPEDGNEEDRLLSPPLDDEVVMDARAPMDLSQLFSFMDGEICTGNKDTGKSSNSVEPSVKDNLKYLSRSQSGSLLTDSSDFDTKASTNHPWGHRTPEERGSATRDMYPPSCKFENNESTLKGQTVQRDKALRGSNIEWVSPVSKGITNGSGPGRPCNGVSKLKPMSCGKPTSDHNGASRSNIAQKTGTVHASSGDKLSVMKSEKDVVDQKLENAKRKLHQGYQQAENAKKQRTVQVLSFPDLPKAGQLVKGKVNPPVQNKVIPPAQNRSGFQGGHGSSQNRRST